MSTACQSPPEQRPELRTPGLDEELSKLLPFQVPLIGVDSLRALKEGMLLLDTRARAEYERSHLPGARWAGFREFDGGRWAELPRDTLIVTYCSVGYRSDLIGQRLREMGFERVYNLYGSLFEWANRGYPLQNERGDTVKEVHTYNEEWSRWIVRPDLQKDW